MDTIAHDRNCVQQVLDELTKIPYTHGNIEIQTVFDTHGDHYLLMLTGWDGPRRVHGSLVHVDLRDGKVWIQRDGTERGIAEALVDSGIPRERIVLGFQPEDVRPYTEYAVA